MKIPFLFLALVLLVETTFAQMGPYEYIYYSEGGGLNIPGANADFDLPYGVPLVNNYDLGQLDESLETLKLTITPYRISGDALAATSWGGYLFTNNGGYMDPDDVYWHFQTNAPVYWSLAISIVPADSIFTAQAGDPVNFTYSIPSDLDLVSSTPGELIIENNSGVRNAGNYTITTNDYTDSMILRYTVGTGGQEDFFAFFGTGNHVKLASAGFTVPEPSTGFLLTLGGALMMLLQRRREVEKG